MQGWEWPSIQRSMVMKDIRGYRQNDIDDIDKVRQIVWSSIAQAAFFIDYKDGE